MLEFTIKGALGAPLTYRFSCFIFALRGGPLIVIFASGLDNGTEAKSFQGEFHNATGQ